MNRKEINIQIGEILRRRRVEIGMTQRELSQATEMTQPSIIAIEKGRRGISLYTLYRLCQELDLTIELMPKTQKKMI